MDGGATLKPIRMTREAIASSAKHSLRTAAACTGRNSRSGRHGGDGRGRDRRPGRPVESGVPRAVSQPAQRLESGRETRAAHDGPFVSPYEPLRQPDHCPNPACWWVVARGSATHRPIGFTYGNPLKTLATGYIDPILLNGEGHLMTIAPTGAGKGTGCIIPALLRYPGPVIVIDPKGENATITARRRREMGQRVVVIDPMGVTDFPSDTLNPLDAIDINLASAVDEVAVLASALCDSDKDERNRFWSNRGLHLAIGVMLQVLVEARTSRGNLTQVRDLINVGASDPVRVAQFLLNSTHPEVQAHLAHVEHRSTRDAGRHDRIQSGHGRLSARRPAPGEHRTTSFDLEDVTRGAPLSIYLSFRRTCSNRTAACCGCGLVR